MEGVTSASVTRRCKQLLKVAEHREELVLVSVDEHDTSQVYSGCGYKMMKNVEVEGSGTLHAVKVCTNCKTVWQRDGNAARNMHNISTVIIGGGQRPLVFCPSVSP